MRRWISFNQAGNNARTNSTIGIALFLLGIVLMTGMDAAVKWLVEDRVHVIQLLVVRSCIIGLLMFVYFSARRQLSQLKPVRLGAQTLRGLLGFLAPFGFFIALKYLPLTAVTVVFFSNIFMITLASALFLKEKVGVYRWSAVALGYVGVMIAINPTAEGELFGYIMTLLSSATYAFLFVSGKRLSNTESSESLVLFYNLGVGVVALFWLADIWQPLTTSDWLGLLLVSVVAVFGQYCLTQAFALAEASLLAPLNYVSLVLALILDWVLWQTVPGAQTMLGAIIIIGSSALVIYRQHQQESKRAMAS